MFNSYVNVYQRVLSRLVHPNYKWINPACPEKAEDIQ